MDITQQGWLSLKWQSFATCLILIITWLAFLVWNWQVGVALMMFLLPIAILVVSGDRRTKPLVPHGNQSLAGRWWCLNQ